MSETATGEQSKIRVYLFGQLAQQEAPQGGDPTPLGKRLIEYLTGQYQGSLSADEARLLFEEFQAQERYRLHLQDAIVRCAGKLQQQAASCVRESDGPYRVSGSYQTGMTLGKYMAYADAAQAVQNVVNEVAISTHDANERLTAERKARLEGQST